MKTIEVLAWNPGFKKVSCTKLLQERAGYSLSRAKATTDAILNRDRVTIELPEEDLDRIVAELAEIGLQFKM
jgi:hypothetical protein